MVKGISRQVIVVHSLDRKLFEQAIFILNENAVGKDGITDELLLKEARQVIGNKGTEKRRQIFPGPIWAFAGAALTGIAWLLTALL